MISEEAYVAARMAITGCGTFLRNIAHEIGLDKTLKIFLHQTEQFVREQRVPRIKRLHESGQLDLNDLAAQFERYWRMGGYDAEVKATPTSTITTTKQCPLYDGFLAAGIDHNTIEVFCRGKDEAGDAIYKRHLGPYAGLKMRKFRSGPDDYCIEEVILKPIEE